MNKHKAPMGIVIPSDINSKPYWLAVQDYTDIQRHVGGHIDAVSTKVDPREFDPGHDGETFVLCGYVHDEGLLIGLPINDRASIMFQRELVGDVVIISGTNPTNGEYDGDNYDVPTWYSDKMFDGTLEWVVRNADALSVTMATAVELAIEDGIYSKDEMDYVFGLMEQGMSELDPRQIELVNNVIVACVLYHKGRSTGQLPKYDAQGMALLENGVTDEMIDEFLRSEGGE